jgi:hypothetical protein
MKDSMEMPVTKVKKMTSKSPTYISHTVLNIIEAEVFYAKKQKILEKYMDKFMFSSIVFN